MKHRQTNHLRARVYNIKLMLCDQYAFDFNLSLTCNISVSETDSKKNVNLNIDSNYSGNR